MFKRIHDLREDRDLQQKEAAAYPIAGDGFSARLFTEYSSSPRTALL